jgi:hypothetical protein
MPIWKARWSPRSSAIGPRRIASRLLVEIADKYQFPSYHAMGRFLSGWARAVGPELAAGLELMEAEFAAAAVAAARGPFHYATMFAEVRMRSGRVGEAYRLIELTLAAEDDPDIGFYLGQLLRLREDCLKRLPKNDTADVSGSLATVIRLAKLHEDCMSALNAAVAAEGQR